LGNEASTENESFREMASEERLPPTGGSPSGKPKLLLDYPHYTRPAEFRGWKVPDVLIGGHHAEVAKWRNQQAERKTRRNRPDLLGEIG
jgi:tRNA G37 N-methylase TrmD